MAPVIHPVRFQVGDFVTVLALGKPGEVIEFCGCFLNPEDLSVGRTSGPTVPLYRVKFRMDELWPPPQRHPDDALCIEIYDHWLAPAAA
jgi:nitrile hydratase